jgi:tetratricopeptide (TPR) repeat protein
MLLRLPVYVAACMLLVFQTACVPVVEPKPDSEQAEYHYILGVSSLNEGNPTAALKEFLLAEKFDDQDPETQSGLAQAYWLKGAHDLAEGHLKKAIQLSDEEPKYYNNLAALYLSMGRYDDAIAAFTKAANNLFFDRPELAWTGVGLANFQKQDYPAAKQAYLKAMEVNPGYYMAPYRLGELYYNQDRPVEALDMFTRSVKLAPKFPEGHYWQGLVYMKMKETAKAKSAFLEVVRLSPNTETARLAGDYLKILSK